MEPLVFLKGLMIGFAIAVPIGPIGILCIRKTLAEGWGPGLVIGLGAATADSLYSGLAAFGLTAVSGFIVSQEMWMRLAGGGVLFFLGIRTLLRSRKESARSFESQRSAGSYASALFLGLTNPVTILGYIVVFAAFELEGMDLLPAMILVVGVYTGSFLWFLTISQIASVFRTRLRSGGLGLVNRVSGGLILAFGVAAFVSVI